MNFMKIGLSLHKETYVNSCKINEYYFWKTNVKENSFINFLAMKPDQNLMRSYKISD